MTCSFRSIPLAVATALIFAIMTALFRSVRLGLIALLPNALPMAPNFAATGALALTALFCTSSARAQDAVIDLSAYEAIDELLRDAQAELYPASLRPTPSDAFAALEYHRRRWPRGDGYCDAAVTLHGRALEGWPALAELLRSPEVRADVGAAAESERAVLARKRGELYAEATAAYDLAIAEQLVAAGDHRARLVAPREPRHVEPRRPRRLLVLRLVERRHAPVVGLHDVSRKLLVEP